MKKIVEEVEGEGLVSLLGQPVLVFCMNYFYAGILSGVHDDDILLTDAGIVYETGPFTEQGYKDLQKLPNDVYVRTASIEAYTVFS